MPLTDLLIKSAKPTGKVYRIHDTGGLYLEISLKGSKLWRLKYRIDRKEKRLALGAYPSVVTCKISMILFCAFLKCWRLSLCPVLLGTLD
jgi:hypothetical protein